MPKKDTFLQVRVSSDLKEWFEKYVDDIDKNMSEVIVDFLEWLKAKSEKEEEKL